MDLDHHLAPISGLRLLQTLWLSVVCVPGGGGQCLNAQREKVFHTVPPPLA